MNVYDFDGTIYYPDCTVSFALWCANRHPKLWFTFVPKALKNLILRKQGIVFKPDVNATPFANSYSVTYKANGGTGDDVVKQEIAGATHTVLANTVTDFDPPATKSFSKWNTKADGSGTDYSPAGTISMTADVVLYAVWA
jgi:hypothetical protein